MNDWVIREYRESDRASLLRIIDLNTPKYFDESERAHFESYLTDELHDYFIIESGGKVLGCGGINYPDDTTAVISWDMIDPNEHGNGIGGKLLRYRLDCIKKNKNINKIIVRTSQFTYLFYQKSGFKLTSIEENYWADGIDLYYMELDI